MFWAVVMFAHVAGAVERTQPGRADTRSRGGRTHAAEEGRRMRPGRADACDRGGRTYTAEARTIYKWRKHRIEMIDNKNLGEERQLFDDSSKALSILSTSKRLLKNMLLCQPLWSNDKDGEYLTFGPEDES